MRSLSKMVLASGVSSLAVLLAAGHASAQSADASGDVEEIVVTGFRQSLAASLETKREALGVVDAISAEDVGKFPDANIAESLQRIPGIAIDRNAGEGRFVTVRGFGPAFNQVLVNGRLVANETNARQFSFDLLPSEVLAGADVYKSGVNHLEAGGIGSTINLKTFRPMDNPDRIIASAMGQYDAQRKSKVPQLFGLVSRHFMDDQVAAMLSVSFQQRKTWVDQSSMGAWNRYDTTAPGRAAQIASNPGNVRTAWYPINSSYARLEDERERINVQGAVQYAPSDNLTLTFDGLWNKFDVEQLTSTYLNFSDLTSMRNIVLDPNGTQLKWDHLANGSFENITGFTRRPTRMLNLGFNAEWQPVENFTTSFDLSYSRVKSEPGNDNYSSAVGGRGVNSFDLTRGIIPQLTLPTTQFEPDNVRGHFAGRTGILNVDDVITQAQINNTWSPETGMLSSIRFGASVTREDKYVANLTTPPLVRNAFAGFSIDPPNDTFERYSPERFLNDIEGVQPIQTYLRPVFDKLMAYYFSPAAAAWRDGQLGQPGATAALMAQAPNLDPIEATTSFKVREETASAYIDVNLEGEWGSVPWALNAGMRTVFTATDARGYSQNIVSISRNPLDQTTYLTVFTPSDINRRNNSYLNLLPAGSLRITPFRDTLFDGDELVMRLSAAQTLTRPALADIVPNQAFGTIRPNELTGSGGNIDLKPYLATNFDFSAEYYWGRLSYISAGVFFKDVQDFVVVRSEYETFNIQNPTGIGGPGDPRNEQLIAGTTARVLMSRPVNAEAAKVKGAELALQLGLDFLPSPFDGFGVLANATFVSSDAKVDVNSLTTNFTIPGLSNSKNATLFYAKGGLDARISWSKRAQFLESFGVEPTFVEPYSQIDFRVSYGFDGPAGGAYEVFVEGNNIGDEKVRKHGRFPEQFVNYQEFGSRYAVGVRMTF